MGPPANSCERGLHARSRRQPGAHRASRSLVVGRRARSHSVPPERPPPRRGVCARRRAGGAGGGHGLARGPLAVASHGRDRHRPGAGARARSRPRLRVHRRSRQRLCVRRAAARRALKRGLAMRTQLSAMLVFALAGAGGHGADAQDRRDERFYYPGAFNWAFLERYPDAARLFNAFDYGHAILYETLSQDRDPPPAPTPPPTHPPPPPPPPRTPPPPTLPH